MKTEASEIQSSTVIPPLKISGILVLCSLFFGVSITEASSVFLLPLTLKLFTDNPQYIFLILAINPAFGLIAQPLVGIWSDRIWTRFGRRGFFLVTCSPLVAISLVLMPYIGSLLLLVILVVWLQFFQDVLNGSDQPLIADLVPPEQRTFVLGLVKTCENVGFMAVLYIGMSWVTSYKVTHAEDQFGLPLYWAAAVAQLVFVMGAALFLREPKRAPVKRPRLTPLRYFKDFFAQPMLGRISAAYFMRAFTRTAVVGSVALYASETLAFSEGQMGRSWGLMPFISLVLGIPLGLLVERFAKQRVLQVGFVAILVGCFIGYFAGSPMGLAFAALCFGLGDMTLEVTHKAFMSDHYPPEKVGQFTGCVNIFYATGRTCALVFVGVAIDWYSRLTQSGSEQAGSGLDYHVIWIVSGISALIGIAILMTVRDHRHEQRLAAKG
jgi:MFS family permease